jgi:hypothetical protein
LARAVGRAAKEYFAARTAQVTDQAPPQVLVETEIIDAEIIEVDVIDAQVIDRSDPRAPQATGAPTAGPEDEVFDAEIVD